MIKLVVIICLGIEYLPLLELLVGKGEAGCLGGLTFGQNVLQRKGSQPVGFPGRHSKQANKNSNNQRPPDPEGLEAMNPKTLPNTIILYNYIV